MWLLLSAFYVSLSSIIWFSNITNHPKAKLMFLAINIAVNYAKKQVDRLYGGTVEVSKHSSFLLLNVHIPGDKKSHTVYIPYVKKSLIKRRKFKIDLYKQGEFLFTIDQSTNIPLMVTPYMLGGDVLRIFNLNGQIVKTVIGNDYLTDDMLCH